MEGWVKTRMKRLLGTVLGLLAMPLCAQTGLQRRPEPPPAYVLGAGDQIVVHVADMDDLPQAPLRIDPSGAVDLPTVGRIQAAGLTTDQLRVELTEKFSKYLRSPDVTVNLAGMESRPVSVLGEVVNPGVHQLVGTTRLLDVLSLSGGIKPDAGPKVVITRRAAAGKLEEPGTTVDPATGDSTASLPLDDLLALKSPEHNIVMHPGDVVSVPKGELIYVLGDVKKAGGYMLSAHQSMSLMEALSLAEGLGLDPAANHARILRPAPGGDGPRQEIAVDVDKIFAGKAPDVPLYANDVLFVPHSGLKANTRRAIDTAIGVGTGVLVYRH